MSICKYCGAEDMDHDYQQLARECYPEQIRLLCERLDLATECIEDGNDTLAQLIRADDEIRSLRNALHEIEETTGEDPSCCRGIAARALT
jgi:hypothetical protein